LADFMGTKSVRPGRRGVKRDAEASGERRNEPGGVIYPTEGRALLDAGGVARRLKWTPLRRGSLLSGEPKSPR
jgi:hypothetical protein